VKNRKNQNKNHKMLVNLVNSAIITCLLFIGGCKESYKTIDDIAYHKYSKVDCVVYIEENNQFEPYLVITSDYDGNVLLLRKYLLPDTMPYKENETGLWTWYDFGAYYEDSSIDHYLTTEFFNTLSQAVKDAIVNSDIVITDKRSMGGPDRIATNISRNIFLLSLEELGIENKYTAVQEGNTLKYFKGDYDRKVTDLPDGSKCAYWTRTPELWETCFVFTIGNNALGAAAADVDSGVRPAFCVKKNTPIRKRTDVVEGQTVYTIE